MSAGEADPQAIGCEPAQETCAACGVKFFCGALAGSCWCEEVKLSSEALSALRARYAKCLCARCLSAAALQAE